MPKVVCFGEIMLRLSPPGQARFVQAEAFEATYGGGEANVAVSLAGFGVGASFVTRLPEGPLGDAAVNHLRRFGVETAGIVRGGGRIGVYFYEKGMSVRPSVVIYDRAHSAIAEAGTDEFDWDAALSGADWLHFTGITPALGGNLPAITRAACRSAKAMGLTVSCDLNYRGKLWGRDKARSVMTPLMEHVDVCIANEEDAYDVFGIRAAGPAASGGDSGAGGDAHGEVARLLSERFGFREAYVTVRESLSASDNGWSAVAYVGGGLLRSDRYMLHINDRVGGGDAFGAGVIYGTLAGMGEAERLNFATAASALKHTVTGDFNLVGVAEVRRLMGGDSSGRVQR